jgi:PKD repeat protein
VRASATSVMQNFLRGRVAELLVFDTGLADAHLQQLEDELYAAHLHDNNQPPNAALAYGPAAPGTGETIRFDGGGSTDADGTITSYAWNFGNGVTGTGAGVQHSYPAAGSYVVTLTVTDNLGAASTATGTVVVSETPGGTPPQPVLRLNASNLTGLANSNPVASWPDPATGRVATAPSAAARAVYKTGQTPTGSAAVHFLGDDYYEVADDPALELDQSSTVIAVVALDMLTSGSQTLVAKHTDADKPGAYFGAISSAGKLLVDRPYKQSGPRSSGGVAAGLFRLLVIRVSGTRVDFRIDRAAAGNGALPTGVVGDNPLRVGAVRASATSVMQNFLRGRVADLLVFDTGLADAHIQQLEDELYAAHLQNEAPNASLAYGPVGPGTGETVRFDASGSTDADGSIASYAWNFGNGVTGTGATVQHSYPAAGNYLVTLTVTDNDGATARATQTVVVSAAPGGARPAAVLRLSAGSLAALANNDPVASWPDPATGRVATAPSAAARAVYKTGQTPAGSAAVHFLGDDYYEVADDPALELDQSSTVVAVVALDVLTSGSQTLVAKHTDADKPGAYFGAVSSAGKLLVDRPYKQAGPRSSGGVAAGPFRLLVIRVSGARVDFRIDRAAAGSGALPTGVIGDNPLRVGAVRASATSVMQNFLRGRVAELLVFDTGLADGHLQQLEDELYAAHLQGNN